MARRRRNSGSELLDGTTRNRGTSSACRWVERRFLGIGAAGECCSHSARHRGSIRQPAALAGWWAEADVRAGVALCVVPSHPTLDKWGRSRLAWRGRRCSYASSRGGMSSTHDSRTCRCQTTARRSGRHQGAAGRGAQRVSCKDRAGGRARSPSPIAKLRSWGPRWGGVAAAHGLRTGDLLHHAPAGVV